MLTTQATRHSETAVCVCVVGDVDVKDFKALTIDDHLRHGPRCPATVLRDTDVAARVGCGDTSELRTKGMLSGLGMPAVCRI